MSRSKFTLNMILGLITGFFILGGLRWIGIDLSLANVWYTVFGEPNWISITTVILITLLVSFYLIHSAYKKYVKT